eukprot:10446436-Ditylum_brightwellii.AAC.1
MFVLAALAVAHSHHVHCAPFVFWQECCDSSVAETADIVHRDVGQLLQHPIHKCCLDLRMYLVALVVWCHPWALGAPAVSVKISCWAFLGQFGTWDECSWDLHLKDVSVFPPA